MGVRLQLSVRDKASGGGLARVAIREVAGIPTNRVLKL
jgi:hypothetical protein